MKYHSKYTFFFVCQEGLLEIQSILLAISLRRNATPYQCIAVSPNIEKIHPITKGLLNDLKVELKEIQNDIQPAYPIGNKVFAMNIPTKTEFKLWIDSDHFCFKSFDPDQDICHDCFAFAHEPEIIMSRPQWEQVYKYFNIPLPQFSGLDKLHVGASLVKIKNNIGFERLWLENLRKLNHANNNNLVQINRRQMDQIALGLTVRKFPEFYIDNPITWNGDHNWWSLPQCTCHPFEKNIPTKERRPNPLLSAPDLMTTFQDNEIKILFEPKFLFLAEGAGYCPNHQGGNPQPHGLSTYPFIRNEIYSIMSEFPIIDRIPAWSYYYKRYFQNTDTSWFRKPPVRAFI